MPKVPVYTVDGKERGSVELPDRLFNVEPVARVVAEVIRIQRANRRRVLAHTKTRADVRGGGRKPWRQKGTGRARHGSIRSPIWKGGGVAHGPRSARNYTMKINAKTRRRALAMSLTDKVKHGTFVVVDSLDMKAPKTQLLSALLAKLPVTRPVLMAVPTSHTAVYRASRNLPGVETIRADSLNVEAVVGARSFLVAKGTVQRIVDTYARGASPVVSTAPVTAAPVPPTKAPGAAKGTKA